MERLSIIKIIPALGPSMAKRVALALDPEPVFLDEPTSGLDPISAGEFDDATELRTSAFAPG